MIYLILALVLDFPTIAARAASQNRPAEAETWINSNTWPLSCWSIFRMAIRTNKLSPVREGDQMPIPRVVITLFAFFSFFPSLFKMILKTAELPVLCSVFSSIYQLFVHIISRSSNSPQLSCPLIV